MIRSITVRLLVGVSIMISISACAPKKIEPTKKPMTEFEKELVVAANSAADAQKMLARVNNAVAMTTLTPNQVSQATWQESHAIAGLQEKVDFDWVGSVEGFARGIAKYTHGWNIHIIGRKPVTVPIVSIFAKNMTIQRIIEDAGTQLGSRMDIIINQNAKPPVIKMRYIDERVHD